MGISFLTSSVCQSRDRLLGSSAFALELRMRRIHFIGLAYSVDGWMKMSKQASHPASSVLFGIVHNLLPPYSVMAIAKSCANYGTD